MDCVTPCPCSSARRLPGLAVPYSSTVEVRLTTGLDRTTVYAFEQLAEDGMRRTRTDPDGLVTTSVITRDGKTVTVLPTGERITEVRGPEPRFGPFTSLPLSVTSTTPTGLTSTTTWARTAVLSNPNDPLSLTRLTETMVTNGRTTTMVYDSPTWTLTATSAAGRASTSVLDAKGRQVRAQLGDLAPTNLTYDGEGRLSRLAQDWARRSGRRHWSTTARGSLHPSPTLSDG